MKNKIILIFVFAIIVLYNPIVKADSSLQYYITTRNARYEKKYGSHNTGGITNSPIIKLNRGDTLDVVVAIDNSFQNNEVVQLTSGVSTIYWDLDVFNLVENNGKYFDTSISDFRTLSVPSNLNGNSNPYVGSTVYDGTVLNRRYISYTVGFETSNEVIATGINKVMQYKFRVKDSIDDGIYSIKLVSGDNNRINYNFGVLKSDDNIIYVQVGDSVTYSTRPVAASDIPNSTYVIGTYMFTNGVSAAYNGRLTTQHIMRAAKSYNSNDLSSMIVYYKNARGVWKNAINNTDITPPASFAISYKDMVPFVEDNPPIVYVVSFDSVGGSKVSNQVVDAGAMAVRPGNPTKQNYTFAGWKLNDNIYNFDIPVNSDITLTATWDIVQYTVAFDSQGGSAVPNQRVNAGGNVIEPPNPIKTNYTFVGWKLNNNSYDFSTPVTGNITLVAEWVPNAQYTISFNSNGGSTVPSQTVYSGGVAEEPGVPTKAHYNFEEWQLNGNSYVFGTPVTSNITLTATWSQKEFTIRKTKVDNLSLDVILTVYEEGQEVSFNSISYEGNNIPSIVNASSIQDITTFQVTLTDGVVVDAVVE